MQRVIFKAPTRHVWIVQDALTQYVWGVAPTKAQAREMIWRITAGHQNEMRCFRPVKYDLVNVIKYKVSGRRIRRTSK